MTMMTNGNDNGPLNNNSILQNKGSEASSHSSYNCTANGTSGNLIWTTGGSSSGQITLAPQKTWNWGGTQIYNNHDCYAIFELPRRKIPRRVYLCGRLVTLGALGTDVECAYAGKKLIFEPGLINALTYNGRVTISLEYDDCTYHYNAGSQGIPAFKSSSKTLDAQLVSKIEHR